MNYRFELETLFLIVKSKLRGPRPTIWFTSDIHFCHKNVIDYCSRPFKSVDEMNKALVRRWNAMVKSQDTVYCLGDFSMNANRMRDFAPLLNGQKFLIPGNHDEVFWGGKKLQKYLDAGWTVLPKHNRRFVGPFVVQMAHMPYGDEEAKKYDTRYFEYRPQKGNEDMLLHGHQHCKYLKNNDRIDVGIDTNFRLYSEADIIKLIKDKRKFIGTRLTGQVSRHGSAS